MPKISRVVEIFLHATGIRVPLNIIHQCWPAWRDETLLQNLEGIRWDIIHKLDEVATRYTSTITWDPFAFPQMDQEYWREEALCYRPGKMLDIGMHMPGFKLMLQNNKGSTPTLAAPSFSKDLCWSMTLNETLHNGCPYEEHLPP